MARVKGEIDFRHICFAIADRATSQLNPSDNVDAAVVND